LIEVDYREAKESKGSPGLWEDLKKTNLPLQKGKLEGGDLFFLGQGPNGTEVTVGVEFKKLRDLLSSLRTQRLQGHQLHELQCYDFRFLLIEGDWKHNDAGQVTMRSGFKNWGPVAGNFSAAELDKTLLGLTLRAGITIKEVSTRRETVRWIQSLYRNFTDAAWEDHTSHVGVYRPPALVRPSPFRNFIMGVPGIGIKTSRVVESFFDGKPRRAVAARADTWSQIEGIGKKGATNIDAFLEGE
jgi:ERCC4-type nuclease